MHKYTPRDFKNCRQVILDDIISELTGHFADNKLNGIERMVCKRLAIELNALRNEGWCAPKKWDIPTDMEIAVQLDIVKPDFNDK